jgi:hypothetical protein
MAAANASRCNWVETVRYFGDLKKWPSPFSLDDTVNASPAPSQSEDVMIGG